MMVVGGVRHLMARFLLRSIFLSTDEAACFSDSMALWVPRRHGEGVRQCLSRILPSQVRASGWLGRTSS